MVERLTRIFALGGMAALLAACAVGPDYQRPATQEGERFARQDAAEQRTATPAPDAVFWRELGDPELTALIEAALAASPDIRVALARYDEANALLGASRFDRYPTLGGSAEATTGRSAASQMPGVSRGDRDGELYDARLTAIWELDFFGRIRRSVEAQRAATEASAADLAAVQVGIVAQLADAYFQLRGAQSQLAVARGNASNQRDTLRLIQGLLDNGRGTAFDRDRAQAQLALTDARVAPLETQVAVLSHRIAVLTGQPPSALVQRLGAPGLDEPGRANPGRANPGRANRRAWPTTINAGTPGDLLRRRPDIAAAERRLHSATARIGVATADLFPRFTLGGLIGTQSLAFGSLFGRDSEMRALTLGIDGSFLDIGRVRARIAAADAQAEGALADYERTVLRAVEETENALVRVSQSHIERAALDEAAASSLRAVDVARLQFEAGAIGVIDVLTAERTRLEAEDLLAQSRTREATSLVSLYVALAGGWPQALPERVAMRAE